MTAIAHDPAAADHDIAHEVDVAGEHEGIEQRLTTAAGEDRMPIIDADQISPLAVATSLPAVSRRLNPTRCLPVVPPGLVATSTAALRVASV